MILYIYMMFLMIFLLVYLTIFYLVWILHNEDRLNLRIGITVCAQSSVFWSEPPKGGGVRSERNESCVSQFRHFWAWNEGLWEPYCDVFFHERRHMMSELILYHTQVTASHMFDLRFIRSKECVSVNNVTSET